MDEQAILVQNTQRLKVAVCILTPLKTIFQPLEITTGSRVLRNKQFGGVEQFLLVHFRDEDNERLRVTNRNIKQRLKNSMFNGIDLFNKTFKYFGASTGQMKEMAFWFIDLPSKLKTITEAHNVLGSFDGIKNIAIYIARVGQYFSTTWPIGIKLIKVENETDIRPNGELNYVLEIPDIERNTYCFTDGIGKISWGLAGRIAQKMNIPLSNKKDIPSAYQIRVAGCKGMVAIDPNSTLNDYYIHVRESMIKFESDDWNLEICEFARPMTLTLNNQVIRLLSDLGNHDDVFIALQKRGFTQWEVPEEQQPTAIDIAVQKNFSYSSSKDNLLTNRIPIPPTEGRNMFGIADETGELKYGECFIQFSSLNPTNNNQRKFNIVTGTVIVTKNPCLWPGDFRRLTAVRNSKLEECMRDVIVFPIDGTRPHPNEISGSDLDGDQYWVYWGESFKINQHVEPLAYAGATKSEVPLISPEKIIEHIVESFGAGIILGMIANTHTVVADKHKQHSFAQPCKQLAELFALAVDSPKTGKFIEKEEIRPFQKDYCTSWPKFMKKFGEPTSNSTSILEQLFTKAEEKYQELHERPMINTFPQRRKDVLVTEIDDPEFEKWLKGGIYQEPTKPKKFQGKKSNKPDDDNSPINNEPVPLPKPKKSEKPQVENKKPSKTPSEETSSRPETPVIAKPKNSETNEKPQAENKKPSKAPSEETSSRPETPVIPKAKKSSDTANSNKLIDSNPVGASAASSLASSPSSSLASANIDQFHPDFLMAADMKITTASVVQFSLASGGLYIVRTNKETTEHPDREQIRNKLTSYIDRQDVFKKKLSTYNETIHGSLYLMIFYGYIYFVEQNPFPQKFNDLQKLITDKYDQIIRFNYANIDELNIPEVSSSTTKKNKIDYELDCHLTSSPSEYYTLLFDKSKTLRQIRVYRIWSKCYVRLPNFHADNIYEIRSLITHDSGSSEFVRISNSIFETDSTGLLGGHKPYITIDRELFRSSVIPISLKVIDEDQQTEINQSAIEAFYRKVKYVSIKVQQNKPKVSSTLEYHVLPISKNENVLEEVCDFALSPIARSSLDRRYSTSSTASSMSNSLFGFSISDD